MLDYNPLTYFGKTDPFSVMYEPTGLPGLNKGLEEEKNKKSSGRNGTGNYDILEKGMKACFPEPGIDVQGLYRKETVQSPLGEYNALTDSYSARIRDDMYSANMRKAEFTRKYNIQSH